MTDNMANEQVQIYVDQNTNQSPYGQPQGNQGQPQGNYRQPQGNYGQPQGNYEQPQGNYGQPQDNYGQPQGNYEQPQDNYEQPQGNYGQPQGNYEQPQDNYEQPQYDQRIPPQIAPKQIYVTSIRRPFPTILDIFLELVVFVGLVITWVYFIPKYNDLPPIVPYYARYGYTYHVGKAYVYTLPILMTLSYFFASLLQCCITLLESDNEQKVIEFYRIQRTYFILHKMFVQAIFSFNIFVYLNVITNKLSIYYLCFGVFLLIPGCIAETWYRSQKVIYNEKIIRDQDQQ